VRRAKRSTYNAGGYGQLKKLFREDPEKARARVLEVLRLVGGNVTAAARRLRFCCRKHFFYELKNRGMLDELERVREETAGLFALPGRPVKRRSWKTGFRLRRDAGLPYKPGHFADHPDRSHTVTKNND
jgi:hypothetical protein